MLDDSHLDMLAVLALTHLINIIYADGRGLGDGSDVQNGRDPERAES